MKGAITLFNIGVSELILILVIALVVFGPAKLPEIGRALGKSLQEFKKATNELSQPTSQDTPPEPPKPPKQNEETK